MSDSDLGARLLAVRSGALPLEHVPASLRPVSLEQAYRTADALLGALGAGRGAVVGYKIGATSTKGQQLLGLQEPFFGRHFSHTIRRERDVRIEVVAGVTVEAEIGFIMARDLPMRREPYTVADVAAAVGYAVPLLELNRPSYAHPFDVGGLSLIADNGVTHALVVGGAGLDTVREGALGREAVRMYRNGELIAEGMGNAVLGDPLVALAWLANALGGHGGLHVGDVVASGALTPGLPFAAGDVITAEYASLGSVTMSAVTAGGR